MKIFAFTDTHCRKKVHEVISKELEHEKPELLICCGDISNFAKDLDKAAKFINNFGIKCLIIPGNHETENEIKKICLKYENLINLHKSFYEFGDYLFFGYGTGGFIFKDKKLEEIIKNFKFNKNKKLIFVTHAPIYGTKLDFLHKKHRGCISSRYFIEKFKPKLTLCGHFHENERIKDQIGDLSIVNPGKYGMKMNI